MSVERKMASQRGLITRSEALEAGLTRHQIQRRIRTGEWVRVHRGVYRHAAAPVSYHQRLQAATMAVDGVASHRPATVLFGLTIFRNPRLEVTHEHGPGRRRAGGVTVHRSTQWNARQELRRMGIRCTGIERTIMDAAGTTTVDMTERLAEDAVRRRLTSFGAIATYLVWHGRQGRTGSANVRAMLLRRAPGAPLPLSDFSRRVVQLLERRGIPEPDLEYRILDDRGRFIMQADLCWPALGAIVELDGLAFHFGRAEHGRDKRKRAHAQAIGWRVLEVIWDMYAEDPAGLADLISGFLETSSGSRAPRTAQ